MNRPSLSSAQIMLFVPDLATGLLCLATALTWATWASAPGGLPLP
jgi:hypothetical protein